jgi:demethylmenaquinone methyltransferase/2-methoxy-6-polyprenyl-1,4-benzoquinol methylase
MGDTKMTDRGKSYDRVAKLYDTAAHLYSGGQIRALKAAQIGELQPGQRILYAGVGDGEDAVLAANRQVTLTLLDLSQGMLDRAAAKFQAVDAEGCIEVVCSDVLRHERPGHYDIVVANFFLNVFTEPMMEAVLARLATMLKPGGKLLIGDFSYPRGWITTRAMQRAYYYVSMFSFWLLGGTPLHPIYDYPQYFDAANLRSAGSQRFKVSALFPVSFETITAVKM